MRKYEKEKKKIYSRILFILDPVKKIAKKKAKKFKIIDNLFPALFLAETEWDRPREGEKKIQAPIPFLLDLSKKIPKKIAKKFEKFKNLSPALFPNKTGWDRQK